MFFRYRIGTEKQAIQAGQTRETWMAQKLAEAESRDRRELRECTESGYALQTAIHLQNCGLSPLFCGAGDRD
jgi:hypothetical protein